MHGAAPVERGVDGGRRHHAAARGEDGHHGLARVGEYARRELKLELDPDGEEEDRHKKVVDKALERDLAGKGAHLDGEALVLATTTAAMAASTMTAATMVPLLVMRSSAGRRSMRRVTAGTATILLGEADRAASFAGVDWFMLLTSSFLAETGELVV